MTGALGVTDVVTGATGDVVTGATGDVVMGASGDPVTDVVAGAGGA